MKERVLLGIDGGGTSTRVLCTNLQGKILSRSRGGGANPSKNENAEQNIRSAISEALTIAKADTGRIAALVAGIAGLDDPEDVQWAERFTSLPGMTIKPTCVNDAVIAWAGALRLESGIVVIAGTGCIIFGVTESGHHLRNYDFHHYADATARNLTFSTLFRILAGETQSADNGLIEQICESFGVADIDELAELAVQNERMDRRERIRLYGNAAPLITRAAEQGVPLAVTVCERAAEDLARGVRLLGACFTSNPVRYALIGSVAQSRAISTPLLNRLNQPTNHDYQFCETLLPPEAGAILLAGRQIGADISPEMIANLAHSESSFE